MSHLFHDLLEKFTALIHANPQRSCLPALARPRRDWAILLSASVLVTVVFLGAGGWMYWSVGHLGISQAEGEVVPRGLNQKKLFDILSQYNARAEEHGRLLRAPAVVIDPMR